MTLYNHESCKSNIFIPEFIKVNEPLKSKTWFKTGGAARWYCEPSTAQEFRDALTFAYIHTLKIFILGEGANIVVHDKGFNGLVIRPCNKTISRYDSSGNNFDDQNYELINAGAGVSFNDLIAWCLDNNLIGLEEFSGIPGTVGGSVFINIHYFKFLLSDFLINAQVINAVTNELITVDHSWFEFRYNYSKLHTQNFYLLNATFRVKKADKLQVAYAQGRRKEIIRHRVTRYPNTRTCGSFFRNFYDNEVTLMSHGKKLIYIAYYLEKIGAKGELSAGDAIVSYQHANMIVNRGNATTQDIIDLTCLMQKKVWDQFGIKPEPECQLVGFDSSPYLI